MVVAFSLPLSIHLPSFLQVSTLSPSPSPSPFIISFCLFAEKTDRGNVWLFLIVFGLSVE
jgi:hypothetical protein